MHAWVKRLFWGYCLLSALAVSIGLGWFVCAVYAKTQQPAPVDNVYRGPKDRLVYSQHERRRILATVKDVARRSNDAQAIMLAEWAQERFFTVMPGVAGDLPHGLLGDTTEPTEGRLGFGVLSSQDLIDYPAWQKRFARVTAFYLPGNLSLYIQRSDEFSEDLLGTIALHEIYHAWDYYLHASSKAFKMDKKGHYDIVAVELPAYAFQLRIATKVGGARYRELVSDAVLFLNQSENMHETERQALNKLKSYFRQRGHVLNAIYHGPPRSAYDEDGRLGSILMTANLSYIDQMYPDKNSASVRYFAKQQLLKKMYGW